MSRKRIVLIVVGTLAALAAVVVGLVIALLMVLGEDPFEAVYAENCGACHGTNLEGTPQGTPLAGVDLKYGDSILEIIKSIAQGSPQSGMPAWSEALDEAQIKSLSIYISERRSGWSMDDFKVDAPLTLPGGPLESEEYVFRIEEVASGLDPLPYSIAPLPDGGLLLTEKMRGLSIISPEGEQSELISGTPRTSDKTIPFLPLKYGVGWLMDVAIHPGYEENGWIYLHHGHLCEGCGLTAKTMNRLIRGRIEAGQWVDEEILWKADREDYTSTSDIAAGGRIAFDEDGHVFFSVGIKGTANYSGVQDLGEPYGKIHRIRDDGEIPGDNPFLETPGALETTWTYGHRNPQGLEFDRATGLLWGTEMGPRGGDEVNLLVAGRNYGWPLYSKGLDYDGTPVEYGKELGIEFDLNAIEQPVVDLTPSPAVSSFVVYDGDLFPVWRGNLIVGSLKGTDLYRIVLEGGVAVHLEVLVDDLARIRDVETGPDGRIYLLLEHGSGGQIVRLVPAD